jgi:Icc-related predicted phosphoesterase
MRAWAFSDIHVDTAAYELPQTPPDIDVIIIAGDVADGHEKSTRWLCEYIVPLGLPVVYVAGNHDFYGTDLTDDYAAIYRDAGVELLHPGRPTIEIAGTRIVGCTLWTDYSVSGDVDAARSWARRSMPDLVSIDIGMRRIGTRDLLDMHRQQRMTIERELWGIFEGPTIVVTHHAPHPKSLRSPMLTADDASYASDLTATIEALEPAVWIHGHVHSSRDFYVSATRIVCNPRGYAVVSRDGRRLENPAFEPGKVIEI